MSLDDAIAAADAPRRYCKLGRLLHEMEPSEGAKLQALLDSTRSAHGLKVILALNKTPVGDLLITEHRRGICGCR